MGVKTALRHGCRVVRDVTSVTWGRIKTTVNALAEVHDAIYNSGYDDAIEGKERDLIKDPTEEQEEVETE